jgi:lipid II isoglutaminyl synthase (glutamine-hydrolysing)
MSEGHGRHRLGSRIPQDPGQERPPGAGPSAPGAGQPVPGPGLPVPGAGQPGPGTGPGGPSAIRLVWVYPDLLSTYGDRGNLLMLARRARLRGIGVELAEVNSDQRVPVDGDIYLLGGGEDLPQILAARRLAADGGLTGAMNRGAVIFAVCAGYQIVGTEFGGAEGEPVPGLGLIDISSGRGDRRGVGEITADVDPALGVERLTGFENHQGVTRRGPQVKPLATVLTGIGNGDGTEGAYSGRVVGTYLHGPALVRNPGLADMLLRWVTGSLPALDPQQEDLVLKLRGERLAAQPVPA